MNPFSVAVIAVLLLLALAAMGRSWARRRRRQSDLALPPAVDPGAPVAAADGMHVATTFAGRPLDRVVVAGLGFRARARIAVHEHAVVLALAGRPDLVVPIARITGVGTGSWALDRGVERGGLLVLAWSLDGPDGAAVPVESAFRLDAAGQRAVLAVLGPRIPVPVAQEVRDADRPT